MPPPSSAEGDLRVNRTLTIPAAELRWGFSGAGGPGGQHANTANTRAELRWDIAGSAGLGPRQRARLLARFGPSLRVVASRSRSQARNRDAARDRLAELVRDALHVERTRVATRPSRAAKRRRIEDKRRHGERKAARRRPDLSD